MPCSVFFSYLCKNQNQKKMTVREYIEFLKKLDQDKQIWVVYDTFTAFEPIPDEVADEDCVERLGRDSETHGVGMKKGDYIIVAG